MIMMMGTSGIMDCWHLLVADGKVLFICISTGCPGVFLLLLFLPLIVCEDEDGGMGLFGSWAGLDWIGLGY
jgi:hypothetical protein